MENEKFFASDKIDFIPNVSTCFFGVTGCGKSHRMVEWAKELQSTGKPFLFILTVYHEPKHPDRTGHWMMQYKLLSLKAVDVSKPILFITDENTTLDDLTNLITIAIQNGIHVFLDESHFHNDLIEFMHLTKYHNFTASAQFFLDSPTVNSSNGISIEDFSNITRKFIGKQQSIATMYFLLGRGGQNFAVLDQGTFFNYPVVAYKEYLRAINTNKDTEKEKAVNQIETIMDSIDGKTPSNKIESIVVSLKSLERNLK